MAAFVAKQMVGNKLSAVKGKDWVLCTKIINSPGGKPFEVFCEARSLHSIMKPNKVRLSASAEKAEEKH